MFQKATVIVPGAEFDAACVVEARLGNGHGLLDCPRVEPATMTKQILTALRENRFIDRNVT